MNNKEIQHALDYHEATKHSEVSIMSSRHYLDYDNRPLPFKVYLEQPQHPLTNNFPTPNLDSITSIAEVKRPANSNTIQDKKSISAMDISEILFFCCRDNQSDEIQLRHLFHACSLCYGSPLSYRIVRRLW